MLTRRALALAALPTFAIGQPARPSLRVAVPKIANSGTLDPLREQSSNASERYIGLILETLIGRDLTPGLATAWHRVDARTVDLTLRRGVVTHDGRTLTADDVQFSFARANAEAPADLAAVAARHIPALDRVEILDAATVRFTTSTPDLALEQRLTAGGTQIVPAATARPWARFAQAPIGTGRYRVIQFRPDVSLTLKAHDAHWAGRPSLATVTFVEMPEAAARADALAAGEVQLATDVAPDQIATIERNPRMAVMGGPVPNHRLVVFDHHHPALRDPRVRQAMAHAVDGQAIVDGLWLGRTRVPAGLQFDSYGPMRIDGWTVPAFDPPLARSLLRDARYDGAPIPYRIRNNYYPAEVATAQVLVEMWRAVGLNVVLSVHENWAQVLGTGVVRGARDWSNSAVFADPSGSLTNQHGPRGAQQTNGEWCNAEFNALSTSLESGMTLAGRRVAFARMLMIAEREDPAYVVLHQTASFIAKPRTLPFQASGTFALDLGAP